MELFSIRIQRTFQLVSTYMCFLYAFDYQVYMTCLFVWHNVCSLSFRNHMLNI